MIIVTGGAGFIGANFVLEWLQSEHAQYGEPVLVLDKLTYAGNMASLAAVAQDARFGFSQTDICDAAAVNALFTAHKPRAIVHFAAESHVDRSIHGPGEFIQTNIIGTFTLLEAARAYYAGLDEAGKAAFRFVHVSTDEVYGSLTEQDPAFSETTAYAPNSPYSASKAASDHLVRAYHHTYKLPVLTTNCSNNYGPLQFPEKLIPLMILNALDGKDLPVYGNGQNIRDWLYVRDHARAIMRVLQAGRVGEVYNIGGNAEKRNLEVVHTLCERLDALRPKASGSYKDQIKFVADRPGHDQRYAIDARKISTELGWSPQEDFTTGMTKTIDWYLTNTQWVSAVRDGSYKTWVEQNYAKR